MIKTLSNIFKQDKEKFVIPKSVQQVIPIETIWSDGIFKIGKNKFARTYKFSDINPVRPPALGSGLISQNLPYLNGGC